MHTLSKKYIPEIVEFATLVARDKAVMYKQRNPETTALKIYSDLYSGKVAEYCLWEMLTKLGYKISKPQVYNENFKHDADFLVDNKKVHVKSFHYLSRYKYTWLVESKADYVMNPGIDDYMALGIGVKELTYRFVWLHCQDIIYKDPIKNMPSKRAIYL